MILNGSFNKKEGWIYTYKRNMKTSVVDYIAANDKAKENILMIEKGDKT